MPDQKNTGPNAAMMCLLEQMRDNPGAISSYAGAGAAAWALGEIQRLRSELQDIADLPGSFFERGDDPSCVIDWAKDALNAK